MKRIRFYVCVLATIVMTTNVANALTFRGEKILTKEPYELGELDLKTVKVEEHVVDFVENEEEEDTGDVFIRWNENAEADFGCGTAKVDYVNPGRSNLGVRVELILTDNRVFAAFGTTFRSETELNELAVAGFERLQEGAPYAGKIDPFFSKGIIKTNKTEYPADFEALVELIVDNEYLGYSKEQWLALTPEKIVGLSEYEKLMIAQFGDYDFKKDYLLLGASGIVNPGYKLTEIQLNTFAENLTLPAGEYAAKFRVVPFDANKSEYSKMAPTIPVKLYVKQDLPKELREEYGIKLAQKVGE